MKEFTFGEEWLEYIEIEIEKKYKISNLNFEIDGVINRNRIDVVNWIDSKLNEHKWIKFKKINNDIFKLIYLTPNPPDAACNKLLNVFFKELKNNSKEIFFELNGSIYDKEKTRAFLFNLLKEGGSEIFYSLKPLLDPLSQGRFIISVSVGDAEIHQQLSSGYLILEIKG